MGTPYDNIFSRFLSFIDDYDFFNLRNGESKEEFDERIEDTLNLYFQRAVAKYTNPVSDLSRDDKMQCFINKIRPLEEEIISLMMLREYYRNKLNFLMGLKGGFSDRDWKNHDKSNKMNQYRQMIKEIEYEIKTLRNENTFSDDNGMKNNEWIG